MKQKKIKRIGIFILFLLFFIFLFNIIYYKSRNYNIQYNIDKCLIKEKYSKEDKKYYINIITNNINFSYITDDKYTNNTKLINEIKVKRVNNYLCIFPKSEKLTLYNLCYKNKIYTTYSYVKNNNISQKYKKFNNIYIYDYNNANYLLWNYDSFIYLNENEKKNIKIFKKDIYNLKNIYQTERYLFIPEQNEYSFKKAYIIDSHNGRIKNIKYNYNLYYDSYYLGDYDNKIYFVDYKNRQEYEIDLKKEHINKINGKILINDKWENISINKILKKEYSFTSENKVIYKIENEYLYALINNKKLLIDGGVSLIIKGKDYEVYYLKNDTLYYNNIYKGNRKIMRYSEWDFNKKDMIFVFN